MFANSQQLLIIILFLCEVITLNNINMNFLFLFIIFLFSFIHPRSWKNNQALDSTLIFIIYSSRTRLHKRIIKQNSQLDHTKNFYSTRSKYYEKDRTKKNGKDKSDGDTIPGHSPKLGSCQGECPYPYAYVSFFGGGDDGGVDGVCFFLNLRLRIEFCSLGSSISCSRLNTFLHSSCLFSCKR